ncbi:MAG: hypothetical protein AB7H88_01810 [Vicinamibacterales bacterium]
MLVGLQAGSATRPPGDEPAPRGAMHADTVHSRELSSMSAAFTLKPLIKRGALVTAANWQVVVAMFVADALFKALLLVPVAGGVLLVVLLVGGDPVDLLSASPSEGLAAMAQVLLAHAGAFGAFLVSVALVLAGGAFLMLIARGGAVAVLVAGERSAGDIEEPPLRFGALSRAARFSLERFTQGSEHLFRRYVALGLGLAAVYAASMGGYLVLILGASPVAPDWPFMAGAASLALVAWFTLVNFVYLLFQVVIGRSDCGVRAAAGEVWRLLTARGGAAWRVFGAILVLVVLATAGSVLATAALGLIAFVPLVGLVALPLQLIAWAVRGAVFQFIELTALVAYLRILRGDEPPPPAESDTTYPRPA